MTTKDFEKAAKEMADKKYLPLPNWNDNDAPVHSRNFVADTNKGSFIYGFLAGCEHAYSIDKESIERLEKEKERLEKELLIVREELAIADHLLKNVP